MSALSFKREVEGSIEGVVERVAAAIKPAGFSILTRIDLDQKFKEKLSEEIPKTVVLGACNPKVAFEAYKMTTDVTLFIPCNIVVRETEPGQVVIEAIKPSAMLQMLPQAIGNELIERAEKDLGAAISGL